MDNYPENLAPKLDEGGGVETPFEEWWERVQPNFPNVPENVAQYWHHEHWGQSPYSWLISMDYKFTLIDWNADDLTQISSRWCDRKGIDDCRKHGKYLITSPTLRTYPTDNIVCYVLRLKFRAQLFFCSFIKGIKRLG